MIFTSINKFKKIILVLSIFLFAFTGVASAYASDTVSFYIESNFDVSGRSKIESVLVKTSSSLYFYVEKNWWNAQSGLKQTEILKNLDDLSVEFENNIYPNLTSIFGYERTPGIDNDKRITIFFHPVRGSEAGYFRTADGYDKLQLPSSNQREMVYISAYLLTSSKLKVALAHEFVHLITFNQKNVNFNVEEDTWLNESRADYSSSILGYEDTYQGSNLQSRVRDFVESPSDSITEWRGVKYDYASVSLFTYYLVDHYGLKILSDSLKSRYVGIESINYVLEKYGYRERFSDIFTNWTIALIVNDCSLGPKYCYLNENLKDIKVVPAINFLPVYGNASLTVISVTKNWAGNWQKFIGGNGDLKLDFSIYNDIKFIVPYVLEDKEGKYSIKFLNIGANRKGTINVPDFGENYKFLIIIPSLQEKVSDFEGQDTAQPFNYSVNVGVNTSSQEESLVQQLLAQIESLKKQIAELQAKLGMAGAGHSYCSAIYSNLYFGLLNNNEVRCLQDFLKSQGAGVYPEGLVTGYFGNLTKSAVIRFQEKYRTEILIPLGLSAGTGYVGPSTRTKINQMLNG